LSVTSDMSVVSPEYSGFIHKTDRRDITEILLKLALNTITPNPHPPIHVMMAFFPSTAFIVLISFYSVPLFFRRKYGMQYLSKWRCYFTWKYTIQFRVHLAWAGFKLTTLVVIGNGCISSCKSYYQTMTTTTLLNGLEL
jgi:hypothetical protein